MEHIIYQLEEDLAILTLNRPEVANGFHISMCEEILEALTRRRESSCAFCFDQREWQSLFSWGRFSRDEAGSG